jgi:hypothetical protein
MSELTTINDYCLRSRDSDSWVEQAKTPTEIKIQDDLALGSR